MKEPKPRGRPKSGAALTVTERTRRLAAKAGLALDPDTALHDLADSALLLALPKAFRAQRADAFARIAAELSRRLGVVSTNIHPVSIPVEITANPLPGVFVDPTDIPAPFTLAPTAPAKPISERDAEILALHAAGVPLRQIARQFGYKSDNSIRYILKQHGV